MITLIKMISNRTHSSKKNVDYLFHVWKEGMQSDEELVEILSNGMKGHNCHLSNSIQIANAVRLPSKRGKLILCRVFLGRSAPYEGSLWFVQHQLTKYFIPC